MSPRRNDPCPCGSGKKYKKCCIETDQRAVAERRVEQAAGRTAPEASMAALAGRRGRSERDRAWDGFFAEWDDAPLDGKLSVLRRAIEHRDELRGHVLADCLQEWTDPLRKAGRAEELEEVLDLLANRRPEVYRAESPWLDAMRVENAVLFLGRDPRRPLLALAARADTHIDRFFDSIDLLSYHGRDEEVLAALEVAWPALKDSSAVMEFAKAELQDLLIELTLFRPGGVAARLASGTIGAAPDLDRLAPVDYDRLARIAAHGCDGAGRHWVREDFAATTAPEELSDNLFFLGHEFGAYLRSAARWPCARAQTGRSLVYGYLVERWNDRTSSRRRRGTRTGSRAGSPGEVDSAVKPDAESAGRYLTSMFRVPT
jgi:hypothetical protein